MEEITKLEFRDDPRLRNLSAADAVRLLERAVKEKGADYQDPSVRDDTGCRYFNEDGTPSCIVGHAFSYQGIDLEDLPRGYDGGFQNGISVDGLFNGHEEPVAHILYRAQCIQDGGGTWGHALREAVKKYSELEGKRWE